MDFSMFEKIYLKFQNANRRYYRHEAILSPIAGNPQLFNVQIKTWICHKNKLIQLNDFKYWDPILFYREEVFRRKKDYALWSGLYIKAIKKHNLT